MATPSVSGSTSAAAAEAESLAPLYGAGETITNVGSGKTQDYIVVLKDQLPAAPRPAPPRG